MITELPVTITLTAPYATRANAISGFGVDLPLLRDGQGRLVLSGTHVIGKLAQAMRNLAALLEGNAQGAAFEGDLKHLFASEAQAKAKDKADGREARRALTASDFVLDSAFVDGGTRTRIARDNATLTVAEGMLQVIEQPFPAGAALAFKGMLRVFGALDQAGQARLAKALGFVPQFGGMRTVGFGVVAKTVFGVVTPARKPAVTAAVGSAPLQLTLRFENPFCAGEGRNTPNIYSSATHVPGGVIKGAIARQLLAAHGLTGFLDDPSNQTKLPAEFQALAQCFGAIRIRHAMPLLQAQTHVTADRQKIMPDSLAVIEHVDGFAVVDLAGLPKPSQLVLLGGKSAIGKFDWKEKHRIAARLALAHIESPKHELRVRTEIDDNRRAAKTNRLFGIEYTKSHLHDFVGVIDLPECAEAQQIADALALVLANGLAGIGRGGAYAKSTLAVDIAADRKAPTGLDRVVMVLMTPALLCAPIAPIDLNSSYDAAFRAIGLPCNWSLSAVFVQQALAGGGFFLNRLTGGNYAPWLLTQSGSTFVFDRIGKGADLPDGWFRDGLPVPPDVLAFHGLQTLSQPYRVCPYLPENGYGEVTIGVLTKDRQLSHVALAPAALKLKVEPFDLIPLGMTA